MRRESAYWSTAEGWLDQGIDFDLVEAPDSLETEEIIEGVAAGTYDLTIADSHILNIELTWRDGIKGLFDVEDTVGHAWAVRPQDTQLRAAIDEFLQEERGELWFALTYNKYFRTKRRISRQVTERPARTGRLSPFDPLFRDYARRYEFDWRLIAAQAFHESRFDPEAQSPVGAVGLMQVMPTTGRMMGFDDLADPEASVHAGTMYLRDQYNRFGDAATDGDRVWFALASYNAGFGHVADARRLAEQRGLDPTRWFGGVAEVAPLLARSEYHSSARYGYCRCQEPVEYVRRIRDTYRAYQEVAGTEGQPPPIP